MLGSLRSFHASSSVNPRLAHEDPKDRATRTRTQRQALAEEAARAAARRQLLERLAKARGRRDGAMRLTADRLREQSEVGQGEAWGVGGMGCACA